MVEKNIGNSISLPKTYWERIEVESERVGLEKSRIIKVGVDLYFSNKKTSKLKHNLTQIILGINLVLVSVVLAVVLSL